MVPKGSPSRIGKTVFVVIQGRSEIRSVHMTLDGAIRTAIRDIAKKQSPSEMVWVLSQHYGGPEFGLDKGCQYLFADGAETGLRIEWKKVRQ